jgi:hypothetical protein
MCDAAKLAEINPDLGQFSFCGAIRAGLPKIMQKHRFAVIFTAQYALEFIVTYAYSSHPRRHLHRLDGRRAD